MELTYHSVISKLATLSITLLLSNQSSVEYGTFR